MAEYQYMPTIPGMVQTVLRMSDQAFIPFDGANRDYRIFTQWLSDGGVPDPAPTLPNADSDAA